MKETILAKAIGLAATLGGYIVLFIFMEFTLLKFFPTFRRMARSTKITTILIIVNIAVTTAAIIVMFEYVSAFNAITHWQLDIHNVKP